MLRITEVAPWSGSNSPVAADWFEVTNFGTTAVDITGWKMDDSSNSFGSAVNLSGITSIAPGESVIFIETDNPAAVAATFRSNWFGANPPIGLQIGSYTGVGVNLDTGAGGDAVNLFDSDGVNQAAVSFGASPGGPFPTFDNAAGLDHVTISTLSVAGTNGAFVAVNSSVETGSPGAIALDPARVSFTVASGDATATAAVVWAKVGVLGPVTARIFSDAGLTNMVSSASGTVTDLDLPLKWEFTGLSAGLDYYYQVTDSLGTAKTGKFKTAVSPGTLGGLHFGVSGDERGELAPYPSVRNAAGKNLDFFLEFGDTIYADVASPNLPISQARTLADYRAKFNEVYSTRHGMNTLADLRASTAVLAVIDDHEVTNDFAGGALRTTDSRFSADTGTYINQTETFTNGVQAFLDYHPIMDVSTGATGDPVTANHRNLYRYSVQGRTAATFVLDTRSFRSAPLPAVTDLNNTTQVTNFLVGSFTPGRTLLGAAQKARFKADLLAAQAAGILWKFVCCPEPLQNFGPLAGQDRYEGYAAERTELLKFIDDNQITNIVFVTADFHGTTVNRLSYQMGPGQPQIQTKSIEIITGPVAYDKPFGPTIVDLAIAAGLAPAGSDAYYQSLDPISKEGFVLAIVNGGLAPLGYNQLSMTANPLPNMKLIGGFYTATNSYGWSEFAIDPVTRKLNVKTWGIDPYSKTQLDANPAAIIARTPAVVSEFDMSPIYTLQVLHFYGESGLLGVQTAPIMGAMIEKFKTKYANSVVVAEGDTFIPGPWLVGGADPSLNAVAGIGSTALGRPDVAICNAFGTTASALGNHEFDLGSAVLQGAIAGSGAWVGAQFPFITSNLNFAGDSFLKGLADTSLGGTATAAGLETTSIKAKFAPYAIKTVNGEKIGFVGATTYDLLTKTSPSGTVPKTSGAVTEAAKLAEVAAYIQTTINALAAAGVNKIIMVDQLDTLERNKQLAPLIHGVDIMVAGGGHERMGDATDTAAAFNGHDATFISDVYPIVTAGSDGKPTLIVTTDTEFSYLGRAVLDFDADGVLILPNLNPAINGAYPATEASLQAAYATANPAATIIAGSTIGSQVKAIVDAINGVVIAKDSNIFGYTNVYLEGDRVYGRAQEVNLGDVTADANAIKAKAALGLGANTAVFSLKNGGGIRASIGSIDEDTFAKTAPAANPATGKPAGAISQLDVENALRFDNKLMVFDTTPQGLLNILNYAAGLAAGNGGFPQVGNVRFSYDPSRPAGQKVRSIVLTDESGVIVNRVVANGAILAGAQAVIPVIALNFTANGGDGYPTKANGSNFRYLLANGTLSSAVNPSLDMTLEATFNTVGITGADLLGEQKAFQDYLAAHFASAAKAYNTTDTPAAQDLRIENLSLRADAVFDGPATFGAWLAANGYTSGGIDKDSDGDGLTDRVEYFFNLDPNDAGDSGNLPQLVPAGGAMNLGFTLLNGLTGVTGNLEISNDLTTWTDAILGVDYTVASSTNHGADTTFSLALPGSGPSAPGTSATYLTPNPSTPMGASLGGVRVVNEGMVGAGRISGSALDSFGETLGASSGLAVTNWAWNGSKFTGKFQVLPDRGYNFGTIFSNYAARLHEIDFTFSPYYGAGPVAQNQIVPSYVGTTKFTYQDGATPKFTTGLNADAIGTLFGQSVGTATAANGPGGSTESLLSFDAEAIYLFPDGSGYVSDEYGAYIARFNPARQITGITQLPESARPHKPVGTLNFDSIAAPTNGRRNNQGLEGLSVTPDRTRLFALLQSATVQDTDGIQQQTRNHARLFVYDIAGSNRETPVLIGEYVVKLPQIDLNSDGSGPDGTAAQSEIVAIGENSFLMLPRDGNGLGKGTTIPIEFKSVQLVDFAAASNILGVYDGAGDQISPAGVLNPSIHAAAAAEVINLLNPADLAKFGFNTNTNPADSNTLNEKLEGMALVPDLSTPQPNDFFLFIGNDNDFQSPDVRMLDAAGNIVSYGDVRLNAGVTNDTTFYAWRITIDAGGKRFYRFAVE